MYSGLSNIQYFFAALLGKNLLFGLALQCIAIERVYALSILLRILMCIWLYAIKLNTLMLSWSGSDSRPCNRLFPMRSRWVFGSFAQYFFYRMGVCGCALSACLHIVLRPNNHVYMPYLLVFLHVNCKRKHTHLHANSKMGDWKKAK